MCLETRPKCLEPLLLSKRPKIAQGYLGPPGLGKSHLVQAIGYQAVKSGYTVLYRSVFDLVREFLHDEVLGRADRRRRGLQSLESSSLFARLA